MPAPELNHIMQTGLAFWASKPGGFDYTGADCISWMKDAGFRETSVEHLIVPDSMVGGIK
jgi:hypothetical protein